MRAAKGNRQLTALSLFTGAGGLDLGIETAGFDIRLCVELEPDCQETLRKNRPLWKLAEPGDIHELSGADLLKQSGLRKRQLTLLTGGPPCQPFSKAGYWITGDVGRLDDPRSDTLAAYMKVVEAMLPECVLLENVRGLGYEEKDEGLALLKRRFKAINKRHRVNYVPNIIVLNAVDYGVPQIRERIFVLAHRKGKKFVKPSPTHCSHQNCDAATCKLKRYSNCWDAIGHLTNCVVEPDMVARGKWSKLLGSIPEGSNYLWHTPRGGGEPIFGWRTRYWSFLLKLAKCIPSWTIQASPGPSTGPFHWSNRLLSIEELCRLQTFPLKYKIAGTRNSAQRQVGNAVPSAIGELLGWEIRRQFLSEPTQYSLTLIPAHRSDLPRPDRRQRVAAEFLILRGNHAEHPGKGLGPGALAR